MNVTLKIAVGQALINIGFKQEFLYASWDRSDSDDQYSAGVVAGFSVYF